MVDLTLLGCGGGMPTPERFLSSLLINFMGHKILVDCGEGTQISMKIANTGFKTIDVICITHIHADHIIGLPGLLSTIGNSNRVEPLLIIGPKGIKEAIEGLMVVVKYLPYEVKVIECPSEDICLYNNTLSISILELDHSTPCIGYSFYFKRRPKFDIEKANYNNVPKILWNKLQKENKSIELNGITYMPNMVMGQPRKGIKLSFITDSRPLITMNEFIKDSDLFICEGTYGCDEDIHKAVKNKHMTFREAAYLAKEGNVKKLLLTHFSTAMADPEFYVDSALRVFKNTIVGSDRLQLNLQFED